MEIKGCYEQPSKTTDHVCYEQLISLERWMRACLTGHRPGEHESKKKHMWGRIHTSQRAPLCAAAAADAAADADDAAAPG